MELHGDKSEFSRLRLIFNRNLTVHKEREKTVALLSEFNSLFSQFHLFIKNGLCDIFEFMQNKIIRDNDRQSKKLIFCNRTECCSC